MTKRYGESFNIAHIEPESNIYGHGKRLVIWLQGCSLACEGCWNKSMWSFKPKELIHRDDLLKTIISAKNIQGVTFLGGEPLHQADNLWWLMKEVRAHTELTIFLYTGYEESELHTLRLWQPANELCDMIAIGRYKQEERNTYQQWIGSNNQFICYPPNSREDKNQQACNEVEIIIEENEEIRILGFPDEHLIDL